MPNEDAAPEIPPGSRFKRLKDHFLYSFMMVAFTGCVSAPAPPCSPDEQPMVLDSLYFGTAKPGGVVTAEEWAAFLDDTVAPDFPEGLTSWTAAGRWRNSVGFVELEASYVLQLTHNSIQEKDRAVQRIVQRYKDRFQQEAVMRIRSQACRSF